MDLAKENKSLSEENKRLKEELEETKAQLDAIKLNSDRDVQPGTLLEGANQQNATSPNSGRAA